MSIQTYDQKTKLNTSGESDFEYVNKNITVANGRVQIFKDKKLVLGANITLMDMAVLIFENCDISVEEISGEIISCCGGERKRIFVSFKNCTICHERKSAYFIKSTSKIYGSDYIFVRFIGCDFEKSQNIVDVYAEDSRSDRNSSCLSIERSKINIDIDRKSALFRCNTLELIDSLFFAKEKEENVFSEKKYFCYAHKMEILNCRFMNLLFKVPQYCECILKASRFKQCSVVIEEFIESCFAYNQKNNLVFAPEKLVSMEGKQMYVEEYFNTNQNRSCWRGNKLLFRNGLIAEIIYVEGSVTKFTGILYSLVELSINNQSDSEINLNTYFRGFWIDNNPFDTEFFIEVKGSASRLIAPGKKVRVKFWAYSERACLYYKDDCTIKMGFGDVMIVVKDENRSWYELA